MSRLHSVALVLLTALVLPLAGPDRAQAADPAGGGDQQQRTVFWANAWAARHTVSGRPALTGARRMERMVHLIARNHADLGVLVELQRSQVRAFERTAGEDYEMVTGGTRHTRDGVFFDPSAYRLVETSSFRSWTKHGKRTRVPVVLLADQATGRQLAVLAVHHAAYDGGVRWREKAMTREIAAIRELQRSHPGPLPVLVGGDFNSTTRAYCRMRRAGFVSPIRPRHGCQHTPVPIDQLFADRSVAFHRYRRIARVQRATDHPAVYLAKFTLRPVG